MTEFPHTDDLPYSVLTQTHDEVRVTHVRAATPAHAIEQVDASKLVGIFRGHIEAVSPEDSQPTKLRNRDASEEVHSVLSQFLGGDESFGLLPGFIGDEETTFLVQYIQTDEGYRIAPLMIPIPSSMLPEVRDEEGNRLVSIKKEHYDEHEEEQ